MSYLMHCSALLPCHCKTSCLRTKPQLLLSMCRGVVLACDAAWPVTLRTIPAALCAPEWSHIRAGAGTGSQLLGVHCVVSGAVPESPVTHQVEAMSGLWEAQLVVAACALPRSLVAALLRAGAKSVVCRRGPSEDPGGSPEPSPEAAVAFFEVRALRTRC